MAALTDRHIAVVPRGEGRVYLSWRLLASDPAEAAFTVQRRRAGENWQDVGEGAVTESTDLVDTLPEPGVQEYRVADARGASPPVAVDSSRPATNLAIEFPLAGQTDELDQVVFGDLVVGDLCNDGRLGFVTCESESGRLVLRAYSQSGKALWHRDTLLPTHGGWDGRSDHVPVAAWDVNADGRTEVLYHAGGGAEYPDDFYDCAREGETLTALDGETGEVIWRADWPATRPRVMFTVGHLRGLDEPASIVVLDGTYRDVVLTAIDGKTGVVQWRVAQARAAGHNLDIGDVDLDGRQEVIAGGVCYRGDGSVLWEAEAFGHTDISKPARYLPDLPGMQVYYAVESENPGVYLVGSDGRTVWKHPFAHAHIGWVGRYEGCGDKLMIHAAEKGAREHEGDAFPIYHPDGSVWMHLTRRQGHKFTPVGGWSADGTIRFIHRKDKRIVRLLGADREEPVPGGEMPAGGVYGRNMACVDIVGDYRENIAGIDRDRRTIFVAINTARAGRRALSPTESFEYRHDRSQLGSGYYTSICPPVV